MKLSDLHNLKGVESADDAEQVKEFVAWIMDTWEDPEVLISFVSEFARQGLMVTSKLHSFNKSEDVDIKLAALLQAVIIAFALVREYEGIIEKVLTYEEKE